MSDLIEAKSDIFFRYVFSKTENRAELLQFINAVFEDSDSSPVLSVEVLNPFNLKEEKLGKESVLDIKAVTEDGTLINIEMQLLGNENYITRSLYYWAKCYSGQLSQGNIYTVLKPVVCINVLNFNLQTTEEQIHSCFQITERHNAQLVLSPDFEIHFIELKKYLSQGKKMNSLLSTWLEYFAKAKEGEDMEYVIQKNPVLGKIDKDFKRFTGTPEFRNYYEEQLKLKRDKEYLIEGARQEGKLEGSYQNAIETAQKMKADKIPMHSIVQYTGLTAEEIEKIKS